MAEEAGPLVVARQLDGAVDVNTLISNHGKLFRKPRMVSMAIRGFLLFVSSLSG